MSIASIFQGGGTRRKSDENWDRLQRQLSDAQRELASVKQEIATLTQERDEARSRSDLHLKWLRGADAEVKRLRHLLGEDAGVPGTEPVPAPIEQGCRDTPASNADTQPVDVSELRDAIGEGDTAVIPVVAIPPAMPLDPVPPVALTDEQKAELTKWATTTGPRDAGPTEVSAITGHLASVKVQLATTSTD